jgi:uncharacterized protein YwqG
MPTLFQLATSLPEEHQQLCDVVADLSDHSRKRKYAQWLEQQNDPRGKFLTLILDEWDAGESFLTDVDSIDMVWQRTCGITLLQNLRVEKFETVDKILMAARPALMINPSLAETEVPIGQSKFGGLPDLIPGRAWPEFRESLLAFIGQINLAELAKTQVAGSLPSKGLLSFFLFNSCDSGEPAEGGEDGAWKVIYSPETAKLKRLSPTDSIVEGNEVAPECVLEFEETLDLPYASTTDFDTKYENQFVGCRRARKLGLTNALSDGYEEMQAALMPDREERSHLLGWSHPQVSCDDPVDIEFRNLLTVASEELCNWCWADGHQLYYGITDHNLQSRSFDQTTIADG